MAEIPTIPPPSDDGGPGPVRPCGACNLHLASNELVGVIDPLREPDLFPLSEMTLTLLTATGTVLAELRLAPELCEEGTDITQVIESPHLASATFATLSWRPANGGERIVQDLPLVRE